MTTLWAVVNIGCIECGVSSNLVGVFDDEARANAIAGQLQHEHEWREAGQNNYEVYPIGSVNVVADEYIEYVKGAQS